MPNELPSGTTYYQNSSSSRKQLKQIKGLHNFTVGAKKWFSDTTYERRNDSEIFTDSETSNDVFQIQLGIGWFKLLSDLICTDIVSVQQEHSTDIE